MRILPFITALALSSACQQEAQTAPNCDLSVSHEVAFTADNARDVITAQTMGASCDRAIAHYALVAADGHPIWAWTAPMPRVFGDVFRDSNPEHMRAFLERWAEPRIERTSAAPPWPLPDYARTSLDRLTYEDIRARDLPMLCHLSGTGLETCVFWEPAAGGAGLFLERDVAASEGSPT